MAYGRDIVIQLPDASICHEDVRQSLAKFVTVLSLTAADTAGTLRARLLSPTHVDHLLNVLSGRLRVGRFLCSFARPRDDGSEDEDEDEDETLVEDVHGSFHDAFLTPPKSSSPIKIDLEDAFLSPPRRKHSPSPLSMIDQSSVFLTPPRSLFQSTLGDDYFPALSPARGGAPARHQAPYQIPIGLHPELPVTDPSPERPENRVPRRRVAELAGIYERAVGAAPAELDCGGAFLPLPPPYHLLPNTPYFRNAPIAPPPLKPAVPPGTAQRIVNRYIASMKVMDNLDEMEIQSLMCFNFNRTIGTCPYTMPEKAPLQLHVDDAVPEDWSIWRSDFRQ